MNEFISVLALAALPAVGTFVGGILSEMVRVSARTLSWALHLAAGILLAIVGIELMPEVLESDAPWVVIVAFVAGGGFSVLLERFINRVRARFGGSEENAAPWMIFAGTAVDLFSDGVIIGTGSLINPALGFLLALGQVPADIPEGFATIATLRDQGLSRTKRLLLALSFALPIFAGATIGFWAVRGQPDLLKFSLLSFMAGLLLTVAVEEMITEAHRNRKEVEEDPIEVLALVGGFALFALISVYLER